MTNSATVPQLITPGVLAAEVGAPLHRIVHILNTRPHIRPAARAGIFRLYDRAAVDLVRNELEAQDGLRKAGKGK